MAIGGTVSRLNTFMIVDMLDKRYEYLATDLNGALMLYIEDTMGFDSGFSLDKDKWITMAEITEALPVKIALINSLCKRSSKRISKVITDYSYKIAYPEYADKLLGLSYKYLGGSDLGYSISGQTYKETIAIIPKKYNGQNVTTIEAKAFANNVYTTCIYIPTTINAIDAAAFDSSCIRTIYYEGNSSDWNTITQNVFDGNGSPYYVAFDTKFDGWFRFQDNSWAYYIANQPEISKWSEINGSWYYFNSAAYMLKNQWLCIEDKWYYFADTGAMKIGWLAYGNEWYYLNNTGSAETPLGAMLTSTWKQVGKDYFYLDSNGKLVTNKWIQNTDGKWYWLLPISTQEGIPGAMARSRWIKYANKLYYAKNNGAMASNEVIPYSDKFCYFNSDGTWDEVYYATKGDAENKIV
jgi:glucan-binding YG repeat protein